MTNVFRLVQRSNRDTVDALDCLASNARNGDVWDLAVLFKTKDGTEEVLFTGAYAAHPEKAISATLRLSMRLTQAQDAPQQGEP